MHPFSILTGCPQYFPALNKQSDIFSLETFTVADEKTDSVYGELKEYRRNGTHGFIALVLSRKRSGVPLIFLIGPNPKSCLDASTVDFGGPGRWYYRLLWADI